MKRGKKDITDKGPKPKSRRARFNDPDDPFGKDSMVFRMKHGDLKDAVAALEKEDRMKQASSSPFASRPSNRSSSRSSSRSSPRSSSSHFSPEDFMREFDSGPAQFGNSGTNKRSSSPRSSDNRIIISSARSNTGFGGRTEKPARSSDNPFFSAKRPEKSSFDKPFSSDKASLPRRPFDDHIIPPKPRSKLLGIKERPRGSSSDTVFSFDQGPSKSNNDFGKRTEGPTKSFPDNPFSSEQESFPRRSSDDRTASRGGFDGRAERSADSSSARDSFSRPPSDDRTASRGGFDGRAERSAVSSSARDSFSRPPSDDRTASRGGFDGRAERMADSSSDRDSFSRPPSDDRTASRGGFDGRAERSANSSSGQGSFSRPPSEDVASFKRLAFERRTGGSANSSSDQGSFSRPPSDDRTASRGGFDGRAERSANSSSDQGSFSRPSSDDSTTPYRSRNDFDGYAERPAESTYQSQRAWGRFSPRESTPWKVDDEAIRIHRATAASQFLYGRSVVTAALRESRRKLYKLYVYEGRGRHNEFDDSIERLAERRRIPVVRTENSAMMLKMSEGRPHNGYILEASPLPQLPIEGLGPLVTDPQPGFRVNVGYQSAEDAAINGTSDLVAYRPFKDRKPFILLLDGILDTGNLGAILRTAGFLGIHAVAITKEYSAPLTAIALKASAGASEALTLFTVKSTADFIERSRRHGWEFYAAVTPQKVSKQNSHFDLAGIETVDPLATKPSVLVIGSEGSGLDRKTRRLVDFAVSIPGYTDQPHLDSLNVSVATALLCASFVKKQGTSMLSIDKKPASSEPVDGDSEDLW
ncbi:hypothetical protein GGR50DRAFT_690509 [Xylaria sp. CBS 124048]|nr:hypothetical protein GGR50DRAFT_690509 [Xylaria sp. CBS 124048]